MKSFLFLVILFVTLPVYAIYDESSIHHKLEEIGIALNHQDFITAKVLRDELLQSASIEEIAKNATYIDYLSFIQELVWEGRDEKFESALILREKYHPEDTERASFLTRKNAEWYTGGDCTSLFTDWIDTIDYAHCIIRDMNHSASQKKSILQPLITSYFLRAQREKNYQAMSDLSIFLSYYMNTFPEQRRMSTRYQIICAKKILAYDPHWVNAYFVLIASSPQSSDRERWKTKLKKNYIGDADRWKSTIEPFIASYQ